MSLSILKLVSIVVTAILGVIGTAYEFRDKGKLTRAGKTAIIVLVLLGAFSFTIQFISSKKEYEESIAAQQKAEEAERKLNTSLERQLEIIGNTEAASSTLGQVIKEMEKEGKIFDESLARQKTIVANTEAANVTLKQLIDEVELQIARLGSPLGKVYFSYSVEYDEADKRFPKYFRRMQTAIPKAFSSTTKGATISPLSELFPQDSENAADFTFNYACAVIGFCSRNDPGQNAFGNLQSDLVFKAYAWADKNSSLAKSMMQSNDIKAPKRGPELFISVNLEKKTICKHVKFAASQLIKDTRKIISLHDIKNPPKPDDLFIQMAIHSNPAFGLPKILELRVHFDETDENVLAMHGSIFSHQSMPDDSIRQYRTFVCSFPQIVEWQKQNPGKSTTPYRKRRF